MAVHSLFEEPRAQSPNVALRPYQIEALAAIMGARDRGAFRGLIVKATGTGKTTTFSEFIRRERARNPEFKCLVLAHQHELLEQAKERIKLLNPGVRISIEGGPYEGLYGSEVIVASVQSIGRRGTRKLHWFKPDVIIVDEAHHACFVAGTLVDGKPIETIKVGDLVRCYDHATGRTCLRPVTAVHKHPAPFQLYRFQVEGQCFTCTGDHPIWNGERYAPARSFSSGDFLYKRITRRSSDTHENEHTNHQPEDLCGLRQNVPTSELELDHDASVLGGVQGHSESGTREEGANDVHSVRYGGDCNGSARARQGSQRAGLLLERVPGCLREEAQFGAHGGHKPQVRISANEGEEPDARRCQSRENGSHSEGDRTSTCDSLWERATYRASEAASRGARLADGSSGSCSPSSNGDTWLADCAEDRRSKPHPQGSDRGGRPFSPSSTCQASRRNEGSGIEATRLEGVEVLEPRSDGTFGPVCADGFVYNISVAEHENYFVNDVLVHNCADSYVAVFENFGVFDGKADLLGFTATPHRMDNKPLHGNVEAIFENILFSYDIRQAIRDGWLCTVRGYRAAAGGLDLSGVKKTAGDYNQGQLQQIMDQDAVTEFAIRKWLEVARDRRTVVFATGVDHARNVAKAFQQRGIKAEAVSGDMHRDDRAAAIKRFRSGETQVLANMQLLTEGVDVPEISCILMLRPTQSWALYSQCLGRGLRLHEGKQDCIAEGTPVLTDAGLVPIECVTRDMKVWDGVEFVTHGGTICRGKQEVIEYAGLIATPDHRVWTQEGWKTLGECASKQIAIAVTGIGGTAVREADGHFRRDHKKGQVRETALTRGMRLWEAVREALRVCCTSAERLSVLRQPATGSSMVGESRNQRQAAMREPASQRLRAIWWPWHRISIRWANCDGAMGQRESWVTPRASIGSDRQQWPLRTGESQVSHAVSESKQHEKEAADRRDARVSNRISRSPLCRRNFGSPTRQGLVLEGCGGTIQQGIVQTQRRVWDILNAGPRHRFTASGLLVSNCVVIDIVGNTERHQLGKSPPVSAAGIFGLPLGLDMAGATVEEAEELFAELTEEQQAAVSTRVIDMAGLSAALTEVDLLSELAIPTELAKVTTWCWLKLSDEHYMLGCGSSGAQQNCRADMMQDALGRWRLVLSSEGEFGSRQEFELGEDLKDASTVAERHAQRTWPNVGAVASANARWRRDPVTDGQRKFLLKVGFKPDQLAKLTKGTASQLISKHISRKKKVSHGR